MKRTSPSLLLAVCSLALLAGCGGGDGGATAKPVARKQPASKPVAVAGVAPAVVPAPAGSQALEADEDASSQLPEGAKPEDVFVVVEPDDTLEIVSPTLGARETDLLELVRPLPGTSSKTFGVTNRPPSPGGSMNPALQLPANFEVLADHGFDDQGYPWRIRCRTDQSVMALVPGGNFMQGTDEGAEEARPRHSVYVDPFYIDVHEVTVAQYNQFRSTLRETQKKLAQPAMNRDASNPLEPAHGVRFSDANLYAQWCGKDLPTEAEWEKAARGTDGEFPWGDGRTVFSRARGRFEITPILSFPQDVSPYGVWDMAGNAREWCRDWYSPTAYRTALDGGETFSNWTGPRNPGPQYLRVVKGNGSDWAAWQRHGVESPQQQEGLGFRCVLSSRQRGSRASANR